MNTETKLPALSFNATNSDSSDFSAYDGKWLILYFYPKDATPGCTIEAHNFRDAYPILQSLNAEVLGISRDSLSAHQRFKLAEALPFDLISDKEEELCRHFDVIKMKSMYGKQVKGIERSTFLIDPQGRVRKEWRQVNVKAHVAEIIETLKSLQNEKQ